MRSLSRRNVVVALVCLATVSVGSLPAQPRSPLPTRLSDAEFWKLVTDLSEGGGNFPSDNFTSNEMGYPGIVASLRASNTSGGAYLGVGPEQNFSYITGIRPQIAFIVDIRRQAVMQHLMYKAIFALSKDRADFLSLLFSKPRPAGLDSASTIATLWDAYWFVPTDTVVYPRNLARIKDHLTKTHGFALDSADLASITYVYEAFYRLGPIISYSGYGAQGIRFLGTTAAVSFSVTRMGVVSSVSGAVAGLTVGSPGNVTSTSGLTNAAFYGGVNFAALSASVDATGNPASFLATEANYRFLKELHSNNLFIPVVGDFAGPKAIRGVGAYVRDRGATITAFYTSNVEQYLFSNNVWARFYENVGTLPVTPASVFIRGGSSLCPISAFVAAVTAGRVQAYSDATRCVR